MSDEKTVKVYPNGSNSLIPFEFLRKGRILHKIWTASGAILFYHTTFKNNSREKEIILSSCMGEGDIELFEKWLVGPERVSPRIRVRNHYSDGINFITGYPTDIIKIGLGSYGFERIYSWINQSSKEKFKEYFDQVGISSEKLREKRDEVIGSGQEILYEYDKLALINEQYKYDYFRDIKSRKNMSSKIEGLVLKLRENLRIFSDKFILNEGIKSIETYLLESLEEIGTNNGRDKITDLLAMVVDFHSENYEGFIMRAKYYSDRWRLPVVI